MAKGLEDTAFYIYNRLAGAERSRRRTAAVSACRVEAFHRTQRRTPARLAGDAAGHFHARHETERRCARADGRDLGDAASLAAFACSAGGRSTAAGSEPSTKRGAGCQRGIFALPNSARHLAAGAVGEPQKQRDTEYIARIQAYMAKALKEAKLNTSWIQPNEQWDTAMQRFRREVLDPSPRTNFSPTFLPVAEEIARLGAINSLLQTAAEIHRAGVPDIYQGNEIWDFSLVDPDNRRPVDYDCGERC